MLQYFFYVLYLKKKNVTVKLILDSQSQQSWPKLNFFISFFCIIKLLTHTSRHIVFAIITMILSIYDEYIYIKTTGINKVSSSKSSFSKELNCLISKSMIPSINHIYVHEFLHGYGFAFTLDGKYATWHSNLRYKKNIFLF